MNIIDSIDKTREAIKAARKEGKTIGFVPTMGYLHEGHMSLVAESRRRTTFQVMSIFVNKIQFNDKNDYAAYPRDLDRDARLAKEAGVDLIFTPDDDIMYRKALTYVDMEQLTDNLCGAKRPGHFRGVFTVVSKLFNIVQPDVAVFGQKDIQQAVSIDKMVADLNFPVDIVIAPTIREKEGLAMSSRNKHLSPGERNNALVIYRSLQKAETLIAAGERDATVIQAAMEGIILSGGPRAIDYISIARYDDLALTSVIDQKSVIAVAAFFGATRLIDNMIINKTGDSFTCQY